MKMDLPPRSIKILKLIISQLNLLLCLVRDVLDLKLIEQGEFQLQSSAFDPNAILEFIQTMFKPQSDMVQTEVSA